jgi:AAA15 family ATPase/GTPase
MQFRRVSIKAFRGIQDLEFYDLGRINLLVGQNNCGKTSVLEAMHVLGNCRAEYGMFPYTSRLNLQEYINQIPKLSLSEILKYYIPDESKENVMFISGYEPILMPNGTYIPDYTAAYSYKNANGSHVVSPKFITNEQDRDNFIILPDLRIISAEELEEYYQSNLTYGAIKEIRKVTSKWIGNNNDKINITSNVKIMELAENYTYLLNGAENTIRSGRRNWIIKIIQKIDSEISNIKTTKNQVILFKQKIEGTNNYASVPLEYFGAATVRMLSLLIKLAECKDGMLMIDEIDTAMHYTHLKEIWETVIAGAEEFNVQVFATTHSNECVMALAK